VHHSQTPASVPYHPHLLKDPQLLTEVCPRKKPLLASRSPDHAPQYTEAKRWSLFFPDSVGRAWEGGFVKSCMSLSLSISKLKPSPPYRMVGQSEYVLARDNASAIRSDADGAHRSQDYSDLNIKTR